MGAFLDIPKGLITKEGSHCSKVNIGGKFRKKGLDILHFYLYLQYFAEYKSYIKGICSKLENGSSKAIVQYAHGSRKEENINF